MTDCAAIDVEWQAARAAGDLARIDAAKVAYRDWCRASSAASKARDEQQAARQCAHRAELRAMIERRHA